MLCRIIKFFFPLFPAEWEKYRQSEIKTVNYSAADSLPPGISIFLSILVGLFCTQVSHSQSKIYPASNNQICTANLDCTGITDLTPGLLTGTFSELKNLSCSELKNLSCSNKAGPLLTEEDQE